MPSSWQDKFEYHKHVPHAVPMSLVRTRVSPAYQKAPFVAQSLGSECQCPTTLALPFPPRAGHA